MHVPTDWLPVLARVGFSADEVTADECKGILAGAWVMAFERMGEKAKPQTPAVPPSSAAPSVARLAAHGGAAPECITGAAQYYHLPVSLLVGVLATEYGQNGQVSHNANGTYDMGPAQINSSWLPRLEGAGITRSMLLSNACLNIAVGAWILAQAMDGASPADPAEFWRHIGNYNSHTPQFNLTYQRRVWQKLQQQNGD
ncbi:MAG: transglycosylase SLT domain-containing protein [Acetobacteraceae bacterium]|nr:transglycosylase SLT domain-containing protein [Acetobacteraceae bacterium]